MLGESCKMEKNFKLHDEIIAIFKNKEKLRIRLLNIVEFPISDGEPIKLPENLEGLPRADHLPSQRHRWNTNEVNNKRKLIFFLILFFKRQSVISCESSIIQLSKHLCNYYWN